MTAYTLFEKEINFANEQDGRFFEVLAHAQGLLLPGYPYQIRSATRSHFAGRIKELREQSFLFAYEEELFEARKHPMQRAIAQMNKPKWPRGVPFDFTAQHNKAFYFALAEASAFRSIGSASYFGIADIRTIRSLLSIRRQRGIAVNDPTDRFTVDCMDMTSRWGRAYEWDADGENRVVLPYSPGWFGCVNFLGEGSIRGDLMIVDLERCAPAVLLGSRSRQDHTPMLIVSSLGPSMSALPRKLEKKYKYLSFESCCLMIAVNREWKDADAYLKCVNKIQSAGIF